MPLLVMLLGRRMGLHVTLALAPQHVFVKFTDDEGKVWNLEATSGAGFTRDLWYRKNLPMTDKAVAAGTYMRALSDEEIVGVLALDLARHDLLAGEPERALAEVEVILKHDPRNALAMVLRGSAFAVLLRKLVGAFPDVSLMPPELQEYAQALYAENQAAFAAAEALGWTEQDGIIPAKTPQQGESP